MAQKIEFKDLIKHIQHLHKRHPKLTEPVVFVLWSVLAICEDDESAAVKAITDGTHDKGIDAIHIDYKAKRVAVIQCKWHKVTPKFEKSHDLRRLIDIASALLSGGDQLSTLLEAAHPVVKEKIEEAHKRVQTNKYELHLYYLSTGKIKEVDKQWYSQQAPERTRYILFSRNDMIRVYRDYYHGIEIIPSLELPISSKSVLHEYDTETNLDYWIFSMDAKSISKIYRQTGNRIFARNVRGFLGIKGTTNKPMLDTLRKEPQNFWYYNNGITFICDNAKKSEELRKSKLIVKFPQIINGQQTTRILAKSNNKSANVFVRVIGVGKVETFAALDILVNKIVKATNSQNPVKASDLRSNDDYQVWLERELKPYNYWYVRKRRDKDENPIPKGYFTVRRNDLVGAIGAVLLDPAKVRKGKEHLYENEVYYTSIFKRRPVDWFLFNYWLFKETKRKSGHERSYAFWHVLNFINHQLSPHFKTREKRWSLVHAAESHAIHGSILEPLGKAIDIVFSQIIGPFYKQEAVTDDGELLDISSFFKRLDLQKKFYKYWKSTKNRRRNTFDRHIKTFLKRLNSMDDYYARR